MRPAVGEVVLRVVEECQGPVAPIPQSLKLQGNNNPTGTGKVLCLFIKEQVGHEPNRDLWRSYFGLNYTVTVNHNVLYDQNSAT